MVAKVLADIVSGTPQAQSIMNIFSRRTLLTAFGCLLLPQAAFALPTPTRVKGLLKATRAQIGVTTSYDEAYRKLAYPMGDAPRATGVCTDVIIRAYRDAFGVDLQRLVHEDMTAHFGSYPNNWGLSAPDSNIDHRRVPNLKAFWKRQGAEKVLDRKSMRFSPGDIITMYFPDDQNLPHVVIATDKFSADGKRSIVLHNYGEGTQEEDMLADGVIDGRYRYLLD